MGPPSCPGFARAEHMRCTIFSAVIWKGYVGGYPGLRPAADEAKPMRSIQSLSSPQCKYKHDMMMMALLSWNCTGIVDLHACLRAMTLDDPMRLRLKRKSANNIIEVLHTHPTYAYTWLVRFSVLYFSGAHPTFESESMKPICESRSVHDVRCMLIINNVI